MGSVEPYLERGVIRFDKVFEIPLADRIPNLTHVYGFEKIHDIVTVLLASFNNSLNLIRPMNEEQIVECAYELVMTTEEDQLSIQDYVLFFKGAKEGKYGRILDRLDQQTVFSMLEDYRQKRHEERMRQKENQHLEYSGLGDPTRKQTTDALSQHLSEYSTKLSAMKDELKEQRAVNQRLRDEF